MNLKKLVCLLPLFLLLACGAGGGSQGRIINKIQANAENGDPHAQYLMGTYYFNGTKDSFGKQVIPQNKEKAKEFFDKAMSSGDKVTQANVSRFLATEELSTQLNISNSMAQNFYNAYGVTTLKEYESAVSEIKSLGYPVKNIANITPSEVIYYLDFKKNANQKNITLPKAVQDLIKEQDVKIVQQKAKEVEVKQQAEQSRQKEIKSREELDRQREIRRSAQNLTMPEWLRSTDSLIKKNPKFAQAVNANFNTNTWGMCSTVGLAVSVSYVKGQKFSGETLFMAAMLIQLGALYQNQQVMKGTPDVVFESSLQAWRHVAILQSEFAKAAYHCSEILSKIITDAK